jgi:hypothetical protein
VGSEFRILFRFMASPQNNCKPNYKRQEQDANSEEKAEEATPIGVIPIEVVRVCRASGQAKQERCK